MEIGHRNRILAEFGAEPFEALASQLASSDLQSLMLEVAKSRASTITPSRVLQRRREDRFVRPSSVDPRQMVLFDSLAFEAAGPSFLPIELSPVCPLGTVSSLAPLSQNNVVTTVRNSEVVADATNCLAIECALRKTGVETIKLCGSHRLLRTQKFEGPASFAHFRIFTMCTAGRDFGGHKFEAEALLEQLTIYLALFQTLRKSGFSFGSARVSLTDFSGQNSDLLEGVIEALKQRFPRDVFQIDPERAQAQGYYDPFCFWIFLMDSEGTEHNVGDGGLTDWTQQLLSNRKERLLISGLGTERMCFLFGPKF
jgi:hypothetical protein